MLGKLFRYDWKENAKGCLILIAVALGMTILAILSLRLFVRMDASGNSTSVGVTPLALAGVLTFFLYAVALIGLIWGGVIYLACSFYNSMYSRRGYLTHTLPVSSWKLWNSKILAGAAWYFLLFLTAILSIACLIGAVLYQAASPQDVRQFASRIGEIWEEILKQLDVRGCEVILQFVLVTLLEKFAFVTILYSAVTLGQLSRKHKGLMAVVWYFVILIVNTLLGNLSALLPVQPVKNQLTPFMDYNKMVVSLGQTLYVSYSLTRVFTVLVQTTVALILYFLSAYIIRKKLNLE